MSAALPSSLARSRTLGAAPKLSRSVSMSRRPVKHDGTKSPRANRAMKPRDPLDIAPDAQRFVLPSGAHFIVRSPPTVVPPTIALASAGPAASTSSSGRDELTHPLASTSAAPSDALPRPHLRTASTEHLAPLSHRAPPSKTLSADELVELRALRLEAPQTHSISALAKRFGVSPGYVARHQRDGRSMEGKTQALALADRQDRIVALHAAQSGHLRELRIAERRARRALW